jgi:glycosyltransferase involved in cell wall biosynthesis
MHLLTALSGLGPVDVMLVHRDCDLDAGNSMSQASALAGFCGRMQLGDWTTAADRWPKLSHRKSMVADLVRGYCAEAPRLGRRNLQALADALPSHQYDLIFAGRLPCAVIADQLLDAGMLQAKRKVVDFDDIMSRVSLRQLDIDGAKQGRLWRSTKRMDARRVHSAEQDVMRSWDSISVCTYEDVDLLQSREPRADLVRVPNVVAKPRLPPTPSDHPRLLFVGSLAHGPNVQGLEAFLETAWPKVQAALPDASLTIVGMLPYAGLREEVERVGAELHVNVPSVEPYYRDCDLVISPIFFGGGTRIKILEAMSYGRPVVSTTIGAEGLQIEPGRHALIADDLGEMADACIRLCQDPRLRTALADAAFELQRREFGPLALDAAIGLMTRSKP